MAGTDGKSGVTRRRFLAVVAGGAASAALAACGGSDATKTPAPSGAPTTASGAPTTAAGAAPTTAAGASPATGAAQPTTAPATSAKTGNKEFHSAWPYQIPPNGHFNVVGGVANGILTSTTNNIYLDMIIQPFAIYKWKEDGWLPLMATEWKFVGTDTFSITLRKGAKWSDGKDFTSKDVLATFSALRLLSATVWKYLDKVEAPDPNTVNFHMKQPSTNVQRYVLRANTVSSAVYGDWAKKIDDLFTAGKTITDPEGKQLLTDFQNFRPTDVVASGPFKYDPKSITQAQMTLVKNPLAWNADQVLFDKIVNYNGETNEITPAVLNKEIDYATQAFPTATEQAITAAGIRIIRPPYYSGPALYMNFDKLGNVFGDKKVRQALAMAINRDQNGKVALGDSGKGVKLLTGFSDNLVPRWLSDADTKALNPYAYDQAKAASMLQEAGWKKGSDGVWTAKDGTRCEFELSVPAEYTDWSGSAQDLADQFTKFGIKTTVRAVTQTQQPIDVDKGNFQLAIQSWGASNPHPSFSLQIDLFLHNTQAVNNGGKGYAFPLKQKTDVAGDVDLEKIVLDSADGLNLDAQKGNVTKAAKVFNELLPIIPLLERYGNNIALEKTRVQAWPPDSDPIMQNGPTADGIVTILMLTGQLKPV